MNVGSIGLGEEMLYITTVPLPPVPWVPPARRVQFDEAGRCFSPVGPDRWEPLEALQPDAYIRAAQVDFDDAPEMEAFLNRYGSPGIDPVTHYDLPWRYFEKGVRSEPFGLGQLNEAVRAEIEEERLKRPFTADETLASVSYGFHSIRLMTYFWMLLSGEPQEKLEGISIVAGSELAAEIEAITMDAGLRSQFAGDLARMLDDALSAFAPHVYHPILAEDDRIEAELHPSAAEAHKRAQPPLFCILALQLAHAMQTNCEVSTCADEQCRRLFAFQTGNRAQKGSRHRGAKYCSDDCARRKTQRDWIRKKRANSRRSQTPEPSET